MLAIDGGIAPIFDHIEIAGPMWTGNGKRWARHVVSFETSFSAPPTVQLSIAMIDADTNRNLRLELYAEDITTTGFTAVAHTWDNTRIGRLQANWIAFGAAEAEMPGAWNV